MKAFKSSKESPIQSTVFVIRGGRRGKPVRFSMCVCHIKHTKTKRKNNKQKKKKEAKRRTITFVFRSLSMKDETRTKIAFLRKTKQKHLIKLGDKEEICKMFFYNISKRETTTLFSQRFALSTKLF